MQSFHPASAGVVLVLSLSLHANAVAQQLHLAPRHAPGDVYDLALSTSTETEAASRGPESRSFEERVTLRYEARVSVLEVDPAGRSVRERHDGVRLSFERPDGSGSLFRNGTRFDVERPEGGAPRLSANGERLDLAVERVVAPLLERQFEHSLGPALLDPGRPVSVGETWELSESVARRLLRESGLRAVEFDGAPSATLAPHPDDERSVQLRYSLPVSWCESESVPANTLTGKSSAILEGRIDLSSAAAGRPVRHVSELRLRMKGVVSKPGVARPFRWRLERSEQADQRVAWISSRAFEDDLAAHPAPAASSPAAPVRSGR